MKATATIFTTLLILVLGACILCATQEWVLGQLETLQTSVPTLLSTLTSGY